MRHTGKKMAGILLAAMCAVGGVTATAGPAQALPCEDCPEPGGGGGGGGNVGTSYPTLAMYDISASWLDGRLLRDYDEITSWKTDISSQVVQIQLHAAENVRWYKEIKVFNRAGVPITGNGWTQDDTKHSVTLQVNAAEAPGATLVLTKGKFWGAHTGVYEVHNLATEVGVGHKLDLYWIRDG